MFADWFWEEGEKVKKGELLVFVSNVRVCILASSCLASNTGVNICWLSDYLVSLSPWGEPLKTVCFLKAFWVMQLYSLFIRFLKLRIICKSVSKHYYILLNGWSMFFFRQWLIIIVVNKFKRAFLQSLGRCIILSKNIVL